MYAHWHPEKNFQRTAALWGIFLKEPVTPEELTCFITYWQAEGKIFHHVQWQQKLARSVQIKRANNNNVTYRDINLSSNPDDKIPEGFQG